VVTEEEDRRQEEEHITSSLKKCSYPARSIRKATKDMQNKGYKRIKKASQKKETKSRATVIIPYMKGLSEALSRILKTYRICTAVRPHSKLRNLLVHPKDRNSNEKKPEVVYKIPCKNCERVYVEETGRPLGPRVKEHRGEVDSVT